MSVAQYPSTLPPPERAEFAHMRGDGRREFRTDAGPSLRRRRFSRAVNAVSFGVMLKTWQVGVLETFWERDLKEGSLPFVMPNWRRHGLMLLTDDLSPLLTDDGVPLLISDYRLYAFGARLPRTVQIAGDAWRVSFDLDELPI